MGRPRTAAALKIAMEIAEKREAAKMAQKLATPPKPYTPKESSTEVLVQTNLSNPIKIALITLTVDVLGRIGIVPAC